MVLQMKKSVIDFYVMSNLQYVSEHWRMPSQKKKRLHVILQMNFENSFKENRNYARFVESYQKDNSNSWDTQ